jgi:hypothetical protein
MPNMTERIQIECHRNDRWQDRVEGSILSGYHTPKHVRAKGKIVRIRKVSVARHRRTMKSWEKALDPLKN